MKSVQHNFLPFFLQKFRSYLISFAVVNMFYNFNLVNKNDDHGKNVNYF